MIRHTVVARDGVTLALHRVPARPGPRGALLLVHGAFTGHRVWLRRGCSTFLTECGFDVWLADLRDHGASAREPAPRAWHFEDWILHDAPALVAAVRAATRGLPLAWIGHSSGGAVGLCATACGAAPCDAIVGIATPGPRRLGTVRHLGARALIALARRLGRFPARALGLGAEDEAADVLADWLDWNVQGEWRGRNGYDYWAALRNVRSPYLAIAGAADRWFAPPAACGQVVNQIGTTHRRLSVHPGLGHRGLLLSRSARETAWRALATWLQETFGR